MYAVIGLIIGCCYIFFIINSDSLILGGGGIIASLYLINKGKEKDNRSKNK